MASLRCRGVVDPASCRRSEPEGLGMLWFASPIGTPIGPSNGSRRVLTRRHPHQLFVWHVVGAVGPSSLVVRRCGLHQSAYRACTGVVWCLGTPIGAPLSSLGRPSSAIATAHVVGPSLGTSASPSCRLNSSFILFPSHSGMRSVWCLASHRLIALLILVLLVVSHRHSSGSSPSLGVSPRGQKLTLGLIRA